MWHDKSRFQVLVCGRRFGKTFYSIERMVAASNKKGAVIGYSAPTRAMAKDIVWDDLKARLKTLGWRFRANESELKITRANGATIKLFTAEKPNAVRGQSFDLFVFDEFAEYRSESIYTALRPALSDRRGGALFPMTPKGMNHGYDFFNRAKTEEGWSAYSFRTIDSPFFQTEDGKKEIEEAKRNLSERDFKQEYEASFENFAGRIYYSYDRETCDTDYEYSPDMPIYVGQDFNRSPMSSCLFQIVGGVSLQFDELFLTYSNTDEVCRVIKQKYGSNKHGIIFRPDATGSRLSSSTTVSDHAIIQGFGFSVQCNNINPPRVDRWASVNRAFEKGLVKVNSRRCPETVQDLEKLCYKEGTCEPDLSDKMRGHLADAFGYHVHMQHPILGKIRQGHYL